jgi:hypothetical protein
LTFIWHLSFDIWNLKREAMTNDKIQMPIQFQDPNDERCSCRLLDFDI